MSIKSQINIREFIISKIDEMLESKYTYKCGVMENRYNDGIEVLELVAYKMVKEEE